MTQSEKPQALPKLNVMVDLETEGRAASARIFAVGLAAFSVSGIKETAYFRINPDTQKGRTTDRETVEWWNAQSADARKEREEAYQTGLDHAYASARIQQSLMEWSASYSSRLVMWGNGSDFDISILSDFMMGRALPWDFWDVQSLRTLRLICPDIHRPEPDIPHHALYDAVAQARWAIAMHNNLCRRHMVRPFL